MKNLMITLMTFVMLLAGCGSSQNMSAEVEEWGIAQTINVAEDGIDIKLPETWTVSTANSETSFGVNVITADSTVNINNLLHIDKLKTADGSTKNTAITDEQVQQLTEDSVSEEVLAKMKESMEVQYESSSLEIVVDEDGVTPIDIDGNIFYRSGIIINLTTGNNLQSIYMDYFFGNANGKLFYIYTSYENDAQKQLLDEIFATITFTTVYATFAGTEDCAVSFSYPEEWVYTEETQMINLDSDNPSISVVLNYAIDESFDNDELLAKLEEQAQFLSEQMQILEGMEDMDLAVSETTTAVIDGASFNCKKMSLQQEGIDSLICELYYGYNNGSDYYIMIAYEAEGHMVVEEFLASISFI